MTPEIEAVRDRLLWEGALIAHLLDLIPPKELDEAVPATDWSVRQTLAHLAFANERQARILASVRESRPAPPVATDEEIAAQAAGARSIAVPALRQLLSDHRAALRTQLARLDEAHLVQEARPGQPVSANVRYWAGHYAEHAWDVLDAVPDARFDPLIANWLLYVDYEGDGRPELRGKQEQLVADFRELMAREGDE